MNSLYPATPFCCAIAIASFALPLVHAADTELPPAQILPFSNGAGTPQLPWRVVGLPRQTKPFTRFTVVELDGHRALRVEADASYGNLVHPLYLPQVPGHLAWQWRAEELNEGVDLHTRAGDDAALRVCVLWDMPIDRVPFMERQWLRAARSLAHEPLPAATVCYVWDAHLPAGTSINSAYTNRLRYVVLRSAGDALHQWAVERRDIGADFIALFGAESPEVPPLIGVAVGADADNTRGHSVAHAADLALQP